MAISLRFHLLLLLISAATANSDDSDTAAAPSCPSPIYHTVIYPPSNFSAVLHTLRFDQLSTTNLSSFTTIVSVSDLSHLSCNIENMALPCTLAACPPPPPSDMPIMLNDAIPRLQDIGYRVVSIALRFKYLELSRLKAMTVFALDDDSIFSDEGGNAYLSNFWYHVVPRKRLTAADLVRLPPRTSFPTMDFGRKLVVTAGDNGEPLDSMKINNLELVTVNLLNNSRIIVHGISPPFRRRRQCHVGYETTESTAGEIRR